MEKPNNFFKYLLFCVVFFVSGNLLAQSEALIPLKKKTDNQRMNSNSVIPPIINNSNAIIINVPGNYPTIQAAINAANNGDIITVNSGVYRENINLNKYVQLRGANYSVNPNTGSRGAETVIEPATSDPDPISPTAVTFFYITPSGSGSIIDGFTFDGDNTTITSSVNINGANIDAAEALGAYEGLSNTTVRNNIIKNINYAGIDFDNYYSSGTATYDNIITDNKFDNIIPTQYGISVLIYDNCYASITNNVMTRVRLGVQTGNFFNPDLGTNHSISNNTIESYRIGIFHNLSYTGATSFDILNNVFTTVPGAPNSNGIEIASIQTSVGVNISNNNINGARNGYYLWNCPTTNTVTVTGGVITNCRVGVLANNYDNLFFDALSAAYAITGVTITGCDTAIKVLDNSLNSSSTTVALNINNTTNNVNGTGIGILLEGGDANVIFNGAAPVNLSDSLNKYIRLATNGTDVPAANINAQSVQFGGVTGSGMTDAVLFTTEDKIDHKIDWVSLGFVSVKANNDYVTLNSFYPPNTSDPLIQRGVDAASTGYIVNVTSGTFEEQLEITLPLTIQGAGSALTSIKSPVTMTKFFNVLSGPNNFPIVYVHDANSVTVRDVTVDGAGRGNTNYRFQGIAYRNAGGTITNCIIKDIRETSLNGNPHGVGIYAFDDNGTSRTLYVLNNVINGFQKNGTALGGADLTTVVDGNTVTGAGPLNMIAQNGIQIGYGATGSITNNTVSGFSFTPNTFLSTALLLFQAAGQVTTYKNNVSASQMGIFYFQVGGIIKENTVNATAATVGINDYWGIDADPGDAPGLRVQPYDTPPSFIRGSRNPFTNLTSFNTSIFRNTLTSDGTHGTAIEMDALGTDVLNATATENVVHGWDAAVVFYKDAGATLNGSANDNDLSNNTYALYNLSGVNQNASCNWFGTANPGIIASKISGSFTYTPYLTNGTDNNTDTAGFQPVPGSCNGPFSALYVNDDSQTGDVYTFATGNNSNSGTPSDPFATLSYAISVASPNDTIWVDAGTYSENPAVNKPLTIFGSNKGTAGSGSRVAESMIRTNGNQNAVITITASNIKIDGLMINGDDPSVTGGPLASGDDANCNYGVRPTGLTNNLTLANNIITKVAIGLRGDVGVSSGNLITRNWFDRIGNFDFGYAVSIRNDYYADVTDNKMTKVWTGLHANNHHTAGGPATWTMSGNEVHSYAAGLCYWLQYQNATAMTVSNNIFSAETGAVANNFGILIVSIQDALNPSFTNNKISGTEYGIGLFNIPTTNNITLGSTDSVIATTKAGIFFTNNLNFNPVGTTNFLAGGPGAASTVKIDGIGISAAGGNGMQIDASGGTATTLNIISPTSINGGATGLLISSGTAAVTGNTVNNLSFTAQTSKYISLSNNALSGIQLDATGTNFDGSTGSSKTLTQNFATEDMINHKIDDGSVGFVLVKTNNDFVTPNSFVSPATTSASVQRAVDAASSGFTANVANGTYDGDVDINKSMTVDGESTSAIIRGLYAGSANTLFISTSNVTLKDVTVTRDYGATLAAWNASGKNQGISIAQSTTGTIINNVLMTGNRNAIFVNNAQNVTITQCTIENNRTGIHFGNNFSGAEVHNNIIRNNFTHGVLFNYDLALGIVATNVHVTENSITGNWYSQVDFQRNSGPVPTGDHTGLSFSCNWYGTTVPSANASNAAEPGYTSQVPSQFGGTDPGLNRQLYGTEIARCPYTPFLTDGTDNDGGTAGFQQVPGSCNGILTKLFVNDNSLSGDVYTTAPGNDLNNGTPSAPFATINHAISVAAAGDSIFIDAGTFGENAVVSKKLMIKGAGNTSIVNPASGACFQFTTGGTSALDRQVLKNIRLTTSGDGILCNTANQQYFTFSHVMSDHNTGNGINFNTSWTVSPADIEIDTCDLSDNGNVGFRLASNSNLNGINFKGGQINNNGVNGFLTGGSGSAGVTNVTIDGTSFTGNGVSQTAGHGDIVFFLFNGTANLSNLNINADASYGIQFRSNTPLSPAGTINLSNINITGTDKNKFGLGFINYTNLNAVTMSNVAINTNPAPTFAGFAMGVLLDGIGSNVNLNGISFGNTHLGNGAGIDIELGGANNVDATGVTFSTSNNYTIEDRIHHSIDVAGPGLVTWIPNNVYVTPNSFYSPATTTPSPQRGINSASAGFTVNVQNGTYNEDIDINKSLTVDGESTAAILRGLYAGSANTVLISVSNVTLKDVTVTRDYGATLAAWNASGKNQGISVGQTTTGTIINDVLMTGNRNALFVNNAQNVTITQCTIENNRTGIHFANNFSGAEVHNNIIRNNFTHGVLFNYDLAVGIVATNVHVNENSITGNWYSQVDFQRNSGPVPTGDHTGLSFSCNWYGTVTPSVVAANAAEPGYTSQVPSQFGGTDPGLNRQLYGTEIARCPYVPFLTNGTDNDGGTAGFQPVPGSCMGYPSKLYVNDNSLTGDVYTSSAGNDANPGTPASPFATIAHAISIANNSDTIYVDAGSYTENDSVYKSLTILGAGRGVTVVRPLISGPTCGGGSLCSGGSNVMLIGANNVSIRKLTIDGNNPALTSGVIAGGVDVDARNGIITNHTLGLFNNLLVDSVTVKNVYLRGIYASSGGTFIFSNDSIDNVQGEAASIGMFNFGGAGIFANNIVSNANDAISSNHSSGSVYYGNAVTLSSSGIHTDNNGDGGGVADTIRNNTVSNSLLYGYGIWVFAPYKGVIVKENTVTNVDVGMANAGQGTSVTAIFTSNIIDGQNKVNSTGVYQTTSLFGFGSSNVKGIYLNNFIKNNTDGFFIEYEAGQTNDITVNDNTIKGNTNGASLSSGGTLVNNFTCNWWGSASSSEVAAAVTAPLNYILYLTDGTDNDLVTAGFQPVPGSCNGQPLDANYGTLNGYSYANSTAGAAGAPSQPQFCWMDTTGSVSLVRNTVNSQPGIFTGDLDDGYWKIVLPGGKKVRFFGNNYDTVRIGTNGIIAFQVFNPAGGNNNPPSLGIPGGTVKNAFYPLWWDQNWGVLNAATSSNRLSYKVSGNQMVITYDKAPRYSGASGDYVSYQVAIDISSSPVSNSRMLVQYADTANQRTGSLFASKYMAGNNQTHLVGLQNAAGTMGIQYRFANTSTTVITPGPLFDSPFGNMAVQFGSDSTKLNHTCQSLNLAFRLETIQLLRKDTVTVMLREATTPNPVIESRSVVYDSVSGTATVPFTLAENGTSYYIIVKHRNSISTWSALPVPCASNTLNYDFTTSLSQAYSNNMKMVGGKASFFTGDICTLNADSTQNGIVQLQDIIRVVNSAATFQAGQYIQSDVNFDNVVGLSDILAVYNNSSIFVVYKAPPGAAPLVVSEPVSQDTRKEENPYSKDLSPQNFKSKEESVKDHKELKDQKDQKSDAERKKIRLPNGSSVR